MQEKNYTWYKIADSMAELHFNENNLLQIDVAGKKICLANTTNDLYACAAKCPHAAGDMVTGFINKNENIICPLHRYSFNLKTGRDTMGEGYYLKIYPVQKKEDGVFVGVERDKNFFSLFR